MMVTKRQSPRKKPVTKTSKSQRASEKSASKRGNPGKGLPSGALVYCLRRFNGSIAVRLSSGELLIPRDDKGNETDLGLHDAYGVTYDTAQDAYWITDKASGRILLLKLSIPKDKSGLAVKVVNETRSPNVRGPCTLDYSSEYGLLVGCYGAICGSVFGSVAHFDGQGWRSLTPEDFNDCVTHVCWLSKGSYCYVTRSDSVLWIADKLDSSPRAMTLPGRRKVLAPPSGPLDKLRLRYVQGICYSEGRRGILVADASLGAIYAINPSKNKYEVVVGEPRLTDSSFRANLHDGPANVCLGPTRAVGEDRSGRIVWLDGEKGNFWSLRTDGSIALIGNALPNGNDSAVAGTGLVIMP